MSHAFYNVVHIAGIVMVMSALGGDAVRAMAGGVDLVHTPKRLLGMLHGIGLFLILLGGFGMLARLGIMQGGSFPGWLWVKLGVWGAIGGALYLPRRWPHLARPVLFALPVLGGLAAFMAIYKPL